MVTLAAAPGRGLSSSYEVSPYASVSAAGIKPHLWGSWLTPLDTPERSPAATSSPRPSLRRGFRCMGRALPNPGSVPSATSTGPGSRTPARIYCRAFVRFSRILFRRS
jgi:hypothetical protein